MNKTVYILLLGFTYAFNFMPSNNSILNYTQIFFKWPQISNAEYYILYLSNNLEDNIELNSLTNSILIDDFISWNNDYYWSVCGFNEFDNASFCYEPIFFSVNNLPAYYPNGNQVLVLDDEYYDGITLLDFDSNGFSAAVDELGNPIWFVDKTLFGNMGILNPKVLVTQLLDSGNFIGIGTGKGYEFDINGEIIFQTPSDYGAHHHFIKKDSTYFLIDAINELNPCPENCPDNLPQEIYWQGDRFVEINSNGDILWDWSTFDYIDLNDYNPLYLDRLSNSYPMQNSMDWTHSNSIFYDNQNIFVSIRNLSRIVKIDYNTKELVWHLGDINFMDEFYFNNTIDFSGQHSVEILDNDNILFFDNHSYLEPEISRCIEFSYNEINDSVYVAWEYILPNLFTGSRGECNRLMNGNTLINVGRTGNLIEVNNDDEIVWHLRMIDNNSDVSSYRALRVDHLYPLIFSFEMDNMDGNYIDQNYNINYSDTLSGTIYNKGWKPQSYTYTLLDQLGNVIYNDVISIDASDSGLILLPTEQLVVDNNQYIIRITPDSNISSYQEIVFYISGSILGDINNDYIINVLDAIELINLILNLEYDFNIDLNSDNILDVLDIILIINIILEQN